WVWRPRPPAPLPPRWHQFEGPVLRRRAARLPVQERQRLSRRLTGNRRRQRRVARRRAGRPSRQLRQDQRPRPIHAALGHAPPPRSLTRPGPPPRSLTRPGPPPRPGSFSDRLVPLPPPVLSRAELSLLPGRVSGRRGPFPLRALSRAEPSPPVPGRLGLVLAV